MNLIFSFHKMTKPLTLSCTFVFFPIDCNFESFYFIIGIDYRCEPITSVMNKIILELRLLRMIMTAGCSSNCLERPPIKT